LMQRANWGPGDRSADVHIGLIRRKLHAAGIDALTIWAVRGQGYRVALRDECGREDGLGPLADPGPAGECD
jgi:hypothetical protein